VDIVTLFAFLLLPVNVVSTSRKVSYMFTFILINSTWLNVSWPVYRDILKLLAFLHARGCKKNRTSRNVVAVRTFCLVLLSHAPLSPIFDASKDFHILIPHTNVAFHRSHFNLNISFLYHARHLHVFIVSRNPQLLKCFYKLYAQCIVKRII
jgi:hypothetical protein